MSNEWILDVIEDSQRGQPVCAACCAPVIPVERGGAIYLECAELGSNQGRLRRLASWGHTRTILITAEQVA
jgi:hypothetical protein